MTLGPVDFFAVKFPGNEFHGEIVPALQDLVSAGTIRIIDLTFARKDAAGNVNVVELHELDDETYAIYEALVGDLNGMLSDDDVAMIANALEPNTSAGVMLFENTWARHLVDTLQNAQAEVMISERIPRIVVDQLVAAQADA